LSELAKKHGNEMIPAGKAFGVPLGLMPKDQIGKLSSMKQRNQLTEQARMAYHLFASLLLANGFLSRLNHASQGGFISSAH
jgi:hypothetical protein